MLFHPICSRRFMVIVALAVAPAGLMSTRADEVTSSETSSVQQTVSSLDQDGDTGSPSGQTEGQFVVHEWGTFTTFSGSDGGFLDFRPLARAHRDLPNYVFDRISKANDNVFALSKRRLRGRVRMETPVVYFYTDRVRQVNVRVDFPQGLLTEFYPPVESLQPPVDSQAALSTGEPIGNSQLDWGTFRVIPHHAMVPTISNPEEQVRVAEKMMRAVVPHGANEQHYAHARETDAALVHVSRDAGRPLRGQREHFEKFLFYRGVGSFELPVKVSFSEGQPVFNNNGQRAIESVILIESHAGVVRAAKMGRVAAENSQALPSTKEVSVNELSEWVSQSLVEQGLYEKEAAAMVNTWKDSWFTEEGRRVLYLVPNEVTEALLPLHVDPVPQERLRVLVGRMEIMSPVDEAKLTELVKKSILSRKVALQGAEIGPLQSLMIKPVYPVPEAIKSWGRMAEPALVRIASISPELAVQQEARELLKQLRTME